MRVGHQRHLRRHHLHHQLHERVERIALYVELRRHHPLEFPSRRYNGYDVKWGADVPVDALRSESLYASCRLYHVGKIPPRELRITAILFIFTLSFVIRRTMNCVLQTAPKRLPYGCLLL